MDKAMMISEVARTYNITKRTIRYYEEEGLLPDSRSSRSKYRHYDEAALNRLEQILLLRELDFSINEIRSILVSDSQKDIDHLLQIKLTELNTEIKGLVSLKNIIASIIRIKNERGMQQVNLYQILKEQIYIHKNLERMFEMSQFVGDIAMVEFGIGIVECADEIINSVKKLRSDIKMEKGIEIPLVRIRDNESLPGTDYRVLIKGITVKQETLADCPASERAHALIDGLKEALLCNLDNITA